MNAPQNSMESGDPFFRKRRQIDWAYVGDVLDQDGIWVQFVMEELVEMWLVFFRIDVFDHSVEIWDDALFA